MYHGAVDVYSRCITFLRCCTDNRASTALRLFQGAVDVFGLPHHVKGDAGSENIDVARFMIENRGANRGSFMVGRSVHNQRIERLWAEVKRVVSGYYKDLFLFMENFGLLDSTDPLHITALHHVYQPRIICGWVCEPVEQPQLEDNGKSVPTPTVDNRNAPTSSASASQATQSCASATSLWSPVECGVKDHQPLHWWWQSWNWTFCQSMWPAWELVY